MGVDVSSHAANCGLVKVAVVDVGTNSTRLLVAEVEDGRVRELDRRTTVTRLGEGVDATGRLGEAAMQRVFEACAEYREAVHEAGAERVLGAARRPWRDPREVPRDVRFRYSSGPELGLQGATCWSRQNPRGARTCER